MEDDMEVDMEADFLHILGEIVEITVQAINNNKRELAKSILKKYNHLLSRIEHYLFFKAIIWNNYEMLTLVYESGADINCKDSIGLGTPLIMSCRRNNYNMAEYCLANGALINFVILESLVPLPNVSDISIIITPLHICVRCARDIKLFEKFLRIFLNYNLNLSDPLYKCCNLFVYALLVENYSAAKVLVENGADVNTLLYAHIHRISVDNDLLCVEEECLEENDDFKVELTNQLSHDMLKLVVYAGINITKLEFPLTLNQNDVRLEFLENVRTNPLKLLDICRINVRRALGRDPLNKIEMLEIPSSLKQRLSLLINL